MKTFGSRFSRLACRGRKATHCAGHSAALGPRVCRPMLWLVAWGVVLPNSHECRAQSPNDGATYAAIVQKNPFRLIPKDVPESPPTVALSPVWSHYKLTGVAADRTNKCAYLAVTIPGQLPRYRTLIAGQTLDAVKVVDIDVEAGTVTLNAAGVVEVFSLATHGLKPPALVPAPPLERASPPAGRPPFTSVADHKRDGEKIRAPFVPAPERARR